MPTTTYEAILALKATGVQEVSNALRTLESAQGRLGSTSRGATSILGGGANAEESARRFRELFAQGGDAAKAFEQTLTRVRAGVDTNTGQMTRDYQNLIGKIKEFRELQSQERVQARDLGPGNASQWAIPGGLGTIKRVPGAPVGSQYAAYSTATSLTDPIGTYGSRTQAAEAVRQDTLLKLQAVIERLTAVFAARQVGLGFQAEGAQRASGASGGGQPPAPPPPADVPDDEGPEEFERALRRSTDTLFAFTRTVELAEDLLADVGAQAGYVRAPGDPLSPEAQRQVDVAELQARQRDIANQARLDAESLRQQVLSNAGPSASRLSILEEAERVRAASFPGLVANQPDPAYAQRLAAEFNRLITATTALARAEESARAQLQREILYERANDPNLSPFQRFGAQFQQGFYGRRDIPFAEQIGQVAKFSVLYGAAYQALFAFQQGLQASIQQSIDYNNALIELTIATGLQSAEAEGFARNLGNAATAYGLTPGEGVRAGAAAVGIFGLRGTTDMEQQAESFATAVSQVAFVTGRTAEQITQDLGAISQAFDLNAGQSRIAQDLDAYFSKRFGSPVGGTIETVAQIGSLGAEAGFNQAETTALASLLQSRTGQTPAATAGFLSQFFGRAGDPALQQTFAELGIDISKPFRDQIAELSKLLKSDSLGEGLRLQIINAFGRGRSGQAASIITEEFGDVTRAARESRSRAAEAGEKQLEERMRSVGGQLAILRGELYDLAVNIGQSGLLDGLYAIVFTFKELVQAANTVLEVFNVLPRPIRDAIVAIGLLAVASRTAAIANSVPANAVGSALLDARAAFGAGGIRGAGSAALSFLSSPAGIFTAATAGLVALAALKSDADNFSKAMNAAGTSLLVFSGAETPDQLRAGADTVRTQADETRDAPGNFYNFATLGRARDEAAATAANMEDIADLANRLANEQERLLEAQARRTQVGVFQNPAIVDDVITGLQQLEAAGVGPVEQLRLLSRAIASVGDESGQAAQRLRGFPNEFTREFLTAIKDEDIIKGLARTSRSLFPEGIPAGGPTRDVGGFQLTGEAGDFALGNIIFGSEQYGRSDPGEFLSALTDPDQGGIDLPAVREQARAYVEEKGRLTGQTVNELIDTALADFNITEIDGKELSPEGQEALKQIVREYLRTQLNDYGRAIDPNKVYNPNELKRLLDETLPKFDQAASTLTAQGYDQGSQQQIQNARRRVQFIRNIPRTQDPGSQYYDRLAEAEAELARQQLARSAALREVLQKQAKTDAEVRRIGRQFFRADLQKALDSGSVEAIRQVVQNASRAQVKAALDSIRNTIQVTKDKLIADEIVGQVAAAGRQLVDGSAAALVASQARVRRRLENLRESYRKLADVFNTTISSNQYNSPDFLDEGDTGTEATAAQIAAARQSAEAARTDDAVAQARAALAAAKADLDAAKPGTIEYYQALEAYYQAQQALTDAITETANARRTAAVAGRDDAIAQARVNLQNAAATLASETPGTLAYYQALAAYKDAQLALDDTIVETENARILARAADRGSPVVTATAELEAARNSLRNEIEGTLAYYQALQNFYEAQRALRDAIREQNIVRLRLAGDVTDPVNEAAADAAAARRQLRYDQRNNSGRDQIQSDRLEVRIAEAAAQQARFQQWLSDLQTNEQLERISHAQYIRTIERRVQRLREVRHRTRQEQEQLDQLLGILKEAGNALSGQFNIGDIKLPTPYEARRYIEERRNQIDSELDAEQDAARPRNPTGARTPPRYTDEAQQNTRSITDRLDELIRKLDRPNLIDIDGADTAQIRRILVDILGRGAINTRSTATSKR